MILKNKMKNCYKSILIFTIIVLFFVVPASATTNLSKNSNGSDKLNDHNYWFVTDPLKEYFVGDLVNISGTTNAPLGSNITILVTGSCYMHPSGYFCSRVFEPVYAITQPTNSNQNASLFSVQLNTSGHESDVYDVYVYGLGSEGNFSVLTLKENVPSINNQTQSKPSQSASQPTPMNTYLIIISLGIVSILYLTINR